MPEQPSTPPAVDSIAAPVAPAASPQQSAQKPKNSSPQSAHASIRMFLLTVFGMPYLMYLGWSGYLLTVLPDPTGAKNSMIATGVLVAVIAGAVFVMIGVFAFMRIGQAKDAPEPRKRFALVRLAAVVVPGLLVSIAVPLAISREPALTLQITSPATQVEFVAPLSISFSVKDAVDILKRRNIIPEKYSWDFEGDGKVNEETFDPEATASFNSVGIYVTSVSISLKGGGTRKLSRRITIPSAVFSVDPSPPILDEPVRLSVAQLVSKPEDVLEVLWDFDGNGEVDLSTKELDVVRTFYVDGPTKVVAVLKLANNSQPRYERTLNVIKTVPLPFEASLTSNPEHLIGPAPLGVVFTVKTQEPIRVILWNFGDGTDARGETAKHTFAKAGVFPVTAELRAESGKVAKITKIVRVVEELNLPDLSFTGTPQVQGNRISGEVPVIINLKPRTSTPLIDFFWEAPDATTLETVKESVKAVYRREGTYTLTLVAQDADDRVLRLPITVEVLPPTAKVLIRMDPEGGIAPLTVRFDASETAIPNETISGFEWQYGDADRGAAQQRGAQVTHVYRRPGTYEVQVKVYTTVGKEYSTSKTIVVRAPVIDACISASRTEGKTPLAVRFSSDCSTLGTDTKFEWNFGDGFTADIKNPTHDFQRPGSYQVILILRDGENSSQSDPLTITVLP